MAKAGPTYPVGVIAKLLMLSDRRVQQLASEGVLPRAEKGHYELAPVVQAYIRYLRDRSSGGDLSDENVGVYKARMIKARTRVAEAEADEIDGSLLRRVAVENAWTKIVASMRARLLAIPSKVAPLVHSSKTIAEASASITAAVHEALEEISRTPVYAAGELPGADDSDGEGSAASGAAAIENDGKPVGRRKAPAQP